MYKRYEPYTEIGIRRLKCSRCGEQASQQWRACAEGSFRPICTNCDVELNELVLSFMRTENMDELMIKYRRRMGVK